MRQYLIGVAAAMAVAGASAPAMASCGGCAPPVFSYSSCAQPVAVNPCGGYGYGYATAAPQVQYYAVQPQPQYYYVNQGPTYTGPGMYAPAVSYQQRAVSGWSGYGVGYYGYNGGPYANPSHHYYHGMPAATSPTVYSYRRAWRAPARYGYGPRYGYAPRHGYAPRYGYGPRHGYAPRVWGPRQNFRYGQRHYVPQAGRGNDFPIHVQPRRYNPYGK